MADQRDLTPILLVDRAGEGGFEFQFDGRVFVFRRGQVTLTTYCDVARFLFNANKLRVWTQEGDFICRLACRDAPGFEGVAAALAGELGGPDMLDTGERIVIDRSRIEGWEADRGAGEVAAVQTGGGRPNEFRERLGRDADSRIVATERG